MIPTVPSAASLTVVAVPRVKNPLCEGTRLVVVALLGCADDHDHADLARERDKTQA